MRIIATNTDPSRCYRIRPGSRSLTASEMEEEKSRAATAPRTKAASTRANLRRRSCCRPHVADGRKAPSSSIFSSSGWRLYRRALTLLLVLATFAAAAAWVSGTSRLLLFLLSSSSSSTAATGRSREPMERLPKPDWIPSPRSSLISLPLRGGARASRRAASDPSVLARRGAAAPGEARAADTNSSTVVRWSDPALRGGGGDSTSSRTAQDPSLTPGAVAVVPLEFAAGTLHARVWVGSAPLEGNGGGSSNLSSSGAHTRRQLQLWIVDTGSVTASTSCTRQSLSRSAAIPRHFDPTRSATFRVHGCGSCELKRQGNSDCLRRQQQQQQQQEQQQQLPLDHQERFIAHDDLAPYLPSLRTASSPSNQGNHSVNQTRLPVVPCRVTQRYTEGSRWTAYEASDVVAIGASTAHGPPRDSSPSSSVLDRRRLENDQAAASSSSFPSSIVSVPFTFGCQTSSTGLFRHQWANGILGLERTEHSYVHQLYRHGRIPRDTFSICLGSGVGGDGSPSSGAVEDVENRGGVGAFPSRGWMGLGGSVSAAASKHLEPMRYAPILGAGGEGDADASGQYRVVLVQVWLGDECLLDRTAAAGRHRAANLRGSTNDPPVDAVRSSGIEAVVDSGTTDTFLPATLARAWEASWLRQTERSWTVDRTAAYTRDELFSLPAVTLVVAAASEPASPESPSAADSHAQSRSSIAIASNGIRWTIPPEHYMEATSAGPTSSRRKRRVATSPDQYDSAPRDGADGWTTATARREFTNRIYVDEPDDRAVLGLNAQRGYDVLYDAENRRIGLAPVLDCV